MVGLGGEPSRIPSLLRAGRDVVAPRAATTVFHALLQPPDVSPPGLAGNVSPHVMPALLPSQARDDLYGRECFGAAG